MNFTNKLIAISFLLFTNFALASDNENCKGMKNIDFSLKNLDVNNDGYISKEEYAVVSQGDIDKTFKHIDANGDGKLDIYEQKEVEDVLEEMHIQKSNSTVNI
ncbi:MAG: hypothetical protein P8Q17_04840 [Methylophilaceae bacterium]|nr:hypothetical protein [Methylophilaceae bacterium]